MTSFDDKIAQAIAEIIRIELRRALRDNGFKVVPEGDQCEMTAFYRERSRLRAQAGENLDTPLSTKPCPFCGSQDVKVRESFDGSVYDPWIVQCQSCNACGPDDNTDLQAVAEWNVRPGETKDPSR